MSTARFTRPWMMLLFTRGSSSSGRFSVGSGPQAQVDPGGMGMELSRSTATLRPLQPAARSQAIAIVATGSTRKRDVMWELLGDRASAPAASRTSHGSIASAASPRLGASPPRWPHVVYPPSHHEAGVRQEGDDHERHRRSAVRPYRRATDPRRGASSPPA